MRLEIEQRPDLLRFGTGARGEFIHPELRTYFRDVHDHLLRQVGRIEGFRDLLRRFRRSGRL